MYDHWRIEGPMGPKRSRFFYFDIQTVRNMAVLGVGALQWEILDPPQILIVFNSLIVNSFFGGGSGLKNSNSENSLLDV